LFFDHEAGEGGGAFRLIQHARRCSFHDAVAWAREWTGIGTHRPFQHDDAALLERQLKRVEAEAEQAADAAKRIGYARRLGSDSTPLAGSVAEIYVTATRGIPAPPAWPRSVGFHAPSQSLILAATNDAGELQAVQRVRLTPEGRKIDGTDALPVKQTNGVLDGAAVRLPGDPAGPVLIAEGPETGLSVWAATGYETMIALGSVANVQPPTGRRIVLCRDDDKLWSPADRKLRDRLRDLRAVGMNVALATPWPTRRQDGSDFNDAIRAVGPDAVRERITAALEPTDAKQPRMQLVAARAYLDASISEFFAATMTWSIEHDDYT
jgi:hypothetical protein